MVKDGKSKKVLSKLMIPFFLNSLICFRHNPRPPDHQPSYSRCRIAPSDKVNELFGFIMVVSCPSTWEGTETAQACKSTNFTADPLTALPVVDMATNVTYANSYCVKCHNTSNHRQPRRVVSGVYLKIEKGENICNSTK